MLDTIRDIYRTFRQYSEMRESPVERWWSYLVQTVTSESLSNVFLGGVASALAAVLTGQAGLWFLGVAIALWGFVFFLYGIVSEIQYAYKAASDEFSEDPREIY